MFSEILASRGVIGDKSLNKSICIIIYITFHPTHEEMCVFRTRRLFKKKMHPF